MRRPEKSGQRDAQSTRKGEGFTEEVFLGVWVIGRKGWMAGEVSQTRNAQGLANGPFWFSKGFCSWQRHSEGRLVLGPAKDQAKGTWPEVLRAPPGVTPQQGPDGPPRGWKTSALRRSPLLFKATSRPPLPGSFLGMSLQGFPFPDLPN